METEPSLAIDSYTMTHIPLLHHGKSIVMRGHFKCNRGYPYKTGFEIDRPMLQETAVDRYVEVVTT